MTYTANRPPIAESGEALRARIPGWGVDLDPADRPAVPMMRSDEAVGSHGELPPPQPEKWPRERSIEHEILTPVFGTACPPRGLSGRMRRLSYRRYSEARAAHWLLLMAADRVDALEHHLASLVTRRPDNPITETGVRSEFSHNGFGSRIGRRRTDVVHQALDPVIVAGPWVLAGAAAYRGVRAIGRRLGGNSRD